MEIRLDGISKSFGNKEVLRNISFSAFGGKAFGLLGRNGAGKTTTLRILMNVLPADGGQVLFNGRPPKYNKIGIGYLPEERGLYPKKKVMDQLTYFAELKGMKRKEAVRAVDQWLDRLEMAKYRNSRLDTLSKGNQQKIQLITAVAHDPQIIILDEPFSGLDPVNAMILEDVVKDEIARGKAVIFSSHQMNYIEEFCDDIGILNGGKIVLQGGLYDIKRHYERNKLVIKSENPDKLVEDMKGSAEKKDEHTVLLTLPSAADKNAAMRYIAENYQVDGIKVFEPSLNHIFVEYTKDRA